MLRPTLVLALLLAAVFAGCTSSGNKSDVASSTTAAPATVTADTGGIEGTIVTDEALPVAGAEVALLQAEQPTKTDAAGRFSFSGLAPGQYDLVAQRIGYASAARKVTVEAGAVANVTLTLQPIAVDTSFVEGPYIFDGHIQLGGLLLDVAMSDLSRMTGVGACTKCELYFNTTEDVVEVVFELKFTPTITKPTEPNILEFQLWSLDADGELDENYAVDSWSSAAKRSFNQETTMAGGDGAMPKKPANYLFFNYCEVFFACTDQRFQIYYTVFHGARAPEEFTALPK